LIPPKAAIILKACGLSPYVTLMNPNAGHPAKTPERHACIAATMRKIQSPWTGDHITAHITARIAASGQVKLDYGQLLLNVLAAKSPNPI
jgi:hypothetical protein